MRSDVRVDVSASAADTVDVTSSDPRPSTARADASESQTRVMDEERGSLDPVDDVAVLIGTHLGRYVVIEELGRGGMGVVLRAYDPKLQREVALKLVRTDRLDPTAQARLVREARAMARLAHPNVVAVYDVETDEAERRVVVVMEYVQGQSLTQWLESANRPLAAILTAFVAAGRGLAAAHAAELLHRDFKPDNVLIGADGQGPEGLGRVRVTDFGLARPTEGGSLEVGLSTSAAGDRDDAASSTTTGGGSDALTTAGTVLGTPLYMAPEQFADEELDTRTDQYAFCVSLWKALTGKWPFRGKDRAALFQAKCKGPPKWPSDVTVPRHIVAAVRRGLASEPSDRWPSLAALLAELQRDPGLRRRQGVALGLLAVAGMGVFGWQRFERALTERDCEAAAASLDTVYGDTRADEIATAFAASGISYAADTWSRARGRLDAYADAWKTTRAQVCHDEWISHTLSPALAEKARACLEGQRESLDALLSTLQEPDARTIAKAASASASLPSVAACADATRLALQPDPPADEAQRVAVRELQSRLSRARSVRTAGRYDEALAMTEAIAADAEAIGWGPVLLEAKMALGDVQGLLAKHAQAQALHEEVFFAAAAQGLDGLALDAATALSFTVGNDMARHDEGLRWGRLARSFATRQGISDGADLARVLSNLAAVHDAKGEYEQAAQLVGEALQIWEEVLGPDHPQVAMGLNNLALDLHNQGKYDQAQPKSERALQIWEAALGPEHPHVAMALNNLGNTLHSKGDLAAAQAMHERALKIREAAFGPDHPAVAASLANLGNALHLQGRSDEARKVFERALKIWEASLGAEHPDLVGIYSNIGVVVAAQGDHARARELFERSIALGDATLGPAHPEVARPLSHFGSMLVDTQHPAEAVDHLQRAEAIFGETVGDDHADTAGVRFDLARALWDSGGDRARARTLARQALAAAEKAGPEAALEQAEYGAWLSGHTLDSAATSTTDGAEAHAQ